MAENDANRGLELQLESLAARIAALRQKMSAAGGIERIEDRGEIEDLQHRYDEIVARLRALQDEGPGFRQEAKAELEKVAADLSGNVEDFVSWVDSGGRGRRPSIRRPKP
jgi:predicted  nucleic acid-binding Zn-ribbon protein